MRLRYLYIRNYPPLDEVGICFNAPALPERECAIRFVVGLNGSGKTHLLQAVAEIFLALAHQQCPHFPVTLAWELGKGDNRRTLVFDNSGHGGEEAWWQSEEIIPNDTRLNQWANLIGELHTGKKGWEELIRDGNWPGEGVGLPTAVLAYTTGCLDPWQWIFRRRTFGADNDIISEPEDYDVGSERPVGWSREREREYQADLGSEESLTEVRRLRQLADERIAKEYDQDICMLIDPILLKFALLAVSLRQAMQDYRDYATDKTFQVLIQQINENPDKIRGLRRIFSQVGWVWPVNVVLQVDFKLDAWGEGGAIKKRKWLQALYSLANEVVREPEPSTQRRLFFDLKASINPVETMVEYFGEIDACEYVGDALQQFLGGAESSPFKAFKRLVDLHRQGLLSDIQIAVRKADVEDILLFDELSDGEREYLGRMALLHLLEEETDVLLLLDEPEVHFNDKWKREIVDIIDSVIKNCANDVLISTHSSITLTDVFNDEIVLFDKIDGQVVPVEIRTNTFGADPSEVMIRLFGVPDSIGERALEWLDTQLDRKWTKKDIPELEEILKRVGPGFHRSELRGILKGLKKKENATYD
ncbi:MAG: AAA family ATPase [Veillonellales bacterium]